MQVNKTQFIDSESGHYGKESSFEQVVLKQMQRCVDVLSEDVYGGTLKVRTGKQGKSETYIEDVREKIINSVDTFRILILRFIKKEQQEGIDKVYKKIKKFKDELGEKKLLIRGRGRIAVKDMDTIQQDSPIWKAFSTFKAENFRTIFEILITVYTKNKQEISSFSEE